VEEPLRAWDIQQPATKILLALGDRLAPE